MSFKISTPEWLKKRHIKAKESVDNAALELEHQPINKVTKPSKPQSHFDASSSQIIIESPVQDSQDVAKTTCPAYLSGDDLIIDQPKCQTIILTPTTSSQKADKSQFASPQRIIGTLNIPTKVSNKPQTLSPSKAQSSQIIIEPEAEEEPEEEEEEEEEPEAEEKQK
jgi:hypothetical protein